jgi:hypothetical protein
MNSDRFSITTNEKGRRRPAHEESCFASAFSEACFPANTGLHSFLSAVIAVYCFSDVKCVTGSRTLAYGTSVSCQQSNDDTSKALIEQEESATFQKLNQVFPEVESELDPTQSCRFEGNSQRWLHTSGWLLVRHRRPLTSKRLIASANREMRFISPDTALNGRQHRRNQVRLCQIHTRHRSRRIPAGTRDSS